MSCVELILGSSIRLPLLCSEWAARMELRQLRTKSLLAKVRECWCNEVMSATGDSRDTISRSSADDSAELTDSVELDRADIRGSLNGDGEAYDRLVQRYQQPIAAYMWRFTRDPQQWEELVQDVFVEAYLSLGGYASRAPLLHWLKRIATRVGYRYWKQRQRRQRESSWPEGTDPLTPEVQSTFAAQEAAEVVHRLLDELAPRDRLVMTLAYLEERSVIEIAKLTGWSRSMVKVQMYRARKRLAKICKKKGIEP